jgi:hypothetical protein
MQKAAPHEAAASPAAKSAASNSSLAIVFLLKKDGSADVRQEKAGGARGFAGKWEREERSAGTLAAGAGVAGRWTGRQGAAETAGGFAGTVADLAQQQSPPLPGQGWLAT